MKKPDPNSGQNKPPAGQPGKPSGAQPPAAPRPAPAPGRPGAPVSRVVPAAGRQPGAPVGKQPIRPAATTRPVPSAAPAPAAAALGPNAGPQEVIDYLAAQIQALATRLEALRAQGAGNTTEFRQLEQMLNMVQDKLMLAQAKIGGR